MIQLTFRLKNELEQAYNNYKIEIEKNTGLKPKHQTIIDAIFKYYFTQKNLYPTNKN